MQYLTFASRLGTMLAIAEGNHLLGLYCQDQANLPDLSGLTETGQQRVLHDVQLQVTEYLSGERQSFTLPFTLNGSRFQQQVLRQLQRIKPGQTLSYKQVAMQIGRPQSVRAVANAIARNPLMLLIPCHRVITSKGQLGGFAAGVQRKQWLLENEGVRVNTTLK